MEQESFIVSLLSRLEVLERRLNNMETIVVELTGSQSLREEDALLANIGSASDPLEAIAILDRHNKKKRRG